MAIVGRIVPKIALSIDQANPATQKALRALNDELPGAWHVYSEGMDTGVAYPPPENEVNAREIVAAALGKIEAKGIHLPQRE